MKRIILLFFVSAALMCCHKQRVTLPEELAKVTTSMNNGLPSDPGKINGYLFGAELRETGKTQKFGQAFAIFRDPAMEMLKFFNHSYHQITSAMVYSSVVSVGKVEFDYNNVDEKPGSAFYDRTFQKDDSLPVYPIWITEGNKTFKPIYQEVERGFPQIVDSLVVRDTIVVDSVNVHTFDLNTIASNFDSLSVILSSSSGPDLRKCVPAGETAITFSNQELQQAANEFRPYFVVTGYNYSHRTIEDKVMVFELARSLKFEVVLHRP